MDHRVGNSDFDQSSGDYTASYYRRVAQESEDAADAADAEIARLKRKVNRLIRKNRKEIAVIEHGDGVELDIKIPHSLGINTFLTTEEAESLMVQLAAILVSESDKGRG